ncbi:MAG: UvrD-helicase domain-containing protein [Treponemataceae bacterium]
MNTEKKPDEFQQKVIKTRINSVVSAGAGSGKTWVLSQRFLDLIKTQNYHVDQILTLTFTKKATIEMSSRIYKTLKENCPEEARNFYKAKIMTLDSYCNMIAKMGSNNFGISPDFIQDEQAIRTKAQQTALQFILEHKESPVIKAIVKTNNYQEIADNLFVDTVLNNSTIVTPIDFEKQLELQKQEITQLWNTQFYKVVQILENMRSDLYESQDKFDDKNTSKTFAEYKKVFDLISEKLPNFFHLSENDFSYPDSFTFEKITSVLETVSKLPKRSIKEIPEYQENVETIRNLNTQIQETINFIQNCNLIKQAGLLFTEYQQSINDFKRTVGILTFSDISDIALKTLKFFPQIRQVEKEKYKAIMIDEFQDNNQMQRDMLFLLAEKYDCCEYDIPKVENLEKEKLFFVGDEKQSIYRFRGADVSVFRGLAKDFNDGFLTMATNYRSHPNLIAAFNTIFGGTPFPISNKILNSISSTDIENDKANETKIDSAALQKKEHFLPAVFFTEKDKDVPDYEAVYKNVILPENKQNELQKDDKKLYEPHIHIARCEDEETEADWVAKKIALILKDGIDGISVSPKDIAILSRNYSLQPLYERTLLKYGIPYSSETVKGVFEDGPINDIYAFLRLIAFPNDKISYASFLRSPFVNLTMEETWSILKQDISPFEQDFEAENKSFLNFTDEAKKRYSQAKKAFFEISEYSKGKRISEVLTKIWYELGYCNETLWNKKVKMFTRFYDILFELARQCEEKNICLASFTDILREYKDENKKLENMDIPTNQTQGVNILSIHKSKGLEFPIVFIVGTHKNSSNADFKNKVFYHKKFGISIKEFSKIFYERAKEENENLEAAELRRVTYVALTRAKNSLFITTGKKKEMDLEKALEFLPGKIKNPKSIYDVLCSLILWHEDSKYLFDIEDVLPLDEQTNIQQIEKNNQNEKSQINELKNDFKSKLLYQKQIQNNTKYLTAQIVETEIQESRIIAPSNLYEYKEDLEKNFDKKCSSFENKADKNIPYFEINQIVNSTIPKDEKEPLFTFANFGTIAHSYLEAAIKCEKPKIKNSDIAGLILSSKSNKNLKLIQEICSQMAQNFLQNELGQNLLKSKWHRCEYEFTMDVSDFEFDNQKLSCQKTNIADNFDFKHKNDKNVSTKFMHGSIDLVFQNQNGKYIIVDYKTDQTIKPEIYNSQLACYRKAVSQMFGNIDEKEIECYLYYLRFNIFRKVF